MNRVLQVEAKSWNEIHLTKTLPPDEIGKVWMDFVRLKIPAATWQIRDTLPDKSFQNWALKKYGSLQKINTTYGTNYQRLEELPIPVGAAVLETFAERENAFAWNNATANFRAVGDFLFFRGQAVGNTIILVVLALLDYINSQSAGRLCAQSFSVARERKNHCFLPCDDGISSSGFGHSRLFVIARFGFAQYVCRAGFAGRGQWHDDLFIKRLFRFAAARALRSRRH